MPAIEWLKIIITFIVILFCSLVSEMSLMWFLSCTGFSIIYYLNIPEHQRYTLVMIVPLVITIAIMQLITGIILSQYNIVMILQTAFRITCITVIVIGSRFFIGTNGFKAFINILPQTLKLFLLIFARILYTLLRLNRMIVYQIQSRINLKSNDKYYIPKYYSIAFVSNQFYSLTNYKNGILSRTIETIPDVVIHSSHSTLEYISITVIIILLLINCFSRGII